MQSANLRNPAHTPMVHFRRNFPAAAMLRRSRRVLRAKICIGGRKVTRENKKIFLTPRPTVTAVVDGSRSRFVRKNRVIRPSIEGACAPGRGTSCWVRLGRLNGPEGRLGFCRDAVSPRKAAGVLPLERRERNFTPARRQRKARAPTPMIDRRNEM